MKTGTHFLADELEKLLSMPLQPEAALHARYGAVRLLQDACDSQVEYAGAPAATAQADRLTASARSVHTHKCGDAVMRYRELMACAAGTLLVFAAPHVWGDAMRCGDKLVQVGDSMAVVKATCGSPADVQHSTVVSATTTGIGTGTRSTTGAEIPVETWTYNRGPDQLMMSIRFSDGRVVSIDTLHEYGN
jgi:Protein of unknown function (DUF2845)